MKMNDRLALVTALGLVASLVGAVIGALLAPATRRGA